MALLSHSKFLQSFLVIYTLSFNSNLVVATDSSLFCLSSNSTYSVYLTRISIAMISDCARRGLKREFAFASAQAYASPPLGRVRARVQNWSNPFVGNDELMSLKRKRAKNSVKKFTTNARVGKQSIPKTPTTDWLIANAAPAPAPAPEGEIDLNAEFVSPAEKDSTFPATEGLMLTGEVMLSAEGNGHPKIDVSAKPKIKAQNISELKKPRLKLRDLMKSGLLEGLPVKYIRGPRVKGPSEDSLKGTISGIGVLCSCDLCEGKKVVSPNMFEVHAGSGNKRPADYIYLENGNNLRSVMNVCIDTPLEGLVLAVQKMISCATEKKEPISKDPVCTLPPIMEDSPIVPSRSLKEPENNYFPAIQGENFECISPRILAKSESSVGVITGSEKETPLLEAVPPSSSAQQSSKSKTQGKRTKKDIRFHRLVFKENVIPDWAPVSYQVHNQEVLEGLKMGTGIMCLCCNVVVSPSQFEAHAGWASRRKPYFHIFVFGISLHELAMQLSQTIKVSDENKDIICSVCGDIDGDGDLISCSSCPRVSHSVCVPLHADPKNVYSCRYCRNNSQIEKNGNRNANALEKAATRCSQVLKVEPEAGGCTCTLCSDPKFSNSGFGPKTVMICDQCDKEYHVGCLKEHKMDDLKELPEGDWLCSTGCNLIHHGLQDLLASGEVNLTKSSMSYIKRKIKAKNSATGAEIDIKWRLLSGKVTSDETRSMLSQAVSIFHDRFDPIEELRPGFPDPIDLIPLMVYGRDLPTRELGGMYCAVLSVDSIVVCAGVFRIFGPEVAELPLVATKTGCDGRGYFKALFYCIEDLLTALNVKNLVLPAAKQAKSIWTKKFGFVKMARNEIKQYSKQYELMVFSGTRLLHKPIMKENVG